MTWSSRYASSSRVYKVDLENDSISRINVPDGTGYGPLYFLSDSIGYLPVWSNTLGSPGFHDECAIYRTDDGGSNWIKETSDKLALIQKFQLLGNRLYANSGSISTETPDVILSTPIDTNLLTNTIFTSQIETIEIFPNPCLSTLFFKGINHFHYRILNFQGKVLGAGIGHQESIWKYYLVVCISWKLILLFKHISKSFLRFSPRYYAVLVTFAPPIPLNYRLPFRSPVFRGQDV